MLQLNRCATRSLFLLATCTGLLVLASCKGDDSRPAPRAETQKPRPMRPAIAAPVDLDRLRFSRRGACRTDHGTQLYEIVTAASSSARPRALGCGSIYGEKMARGVAPVAVIEGKPPSQKLGTEKAIRIYDATGRLLLQTRLPGVSDAHLRQGRYLVVMTSGFMEGAIMQIHDVQTKRHAALTITGLPRFRGDRVAWLWPASDKTTLRCYHLRTGRHTTLVTVPELLGHSVRITWRSATRVEIRGTRKTDGAVWKKTVACQ